MNLKKEIFYQIYPSSFKDSNDDGIGDLNGISEKIPYLKKLGVTTIWLSPIYKSPMKDNGYDISDYYQVDPRFGTMEDLDRLISKIHKNGMKLIMDLVINHTSDQHIWFKKALDDPTSKYHNYYIFKKGSNGNPPNNWRSNFGYGSAWKYIGNNEYYLHVFSEHQPDLNWENPDLRSDIYSMINWWLDKGIDGFRIDAITFLKKDQDFSSLEPDGKDGLAKVKKKSENRPGIEKFLNELNQKCFKDRDIVTVGEASGIKYQDLGKYIGQDGVFSMVFDFHYADIDVESGSEWYKRTNWKPQELRELIDKSQLSIQAVKNGWPANFLENHDQPRSVTKYIKDPKYRNSTGAKALALMYFFLRGCPFIYQGEELGTQNFERSNINEFNDVSSISNYKRMLDLGYSPDQALYYVNLRSRDNGRTPFKWDSTVNSGFNTGAKPWLEFNNNLNNQSAAQEIEDQNSVFNFYRKMIEIRNKPEYEKELIYGEYAPIKDLPSNVIGYQRGNNFKVLVNLSTADVTIPVKNCSVILSNYKASNFANNNELQPYEAVLLEEINNG
ncbi:alpha-glucosidase [Lactobacillus colini]|uniref:Alpha-glucosidase n=1 Tax=Lactobacillus colini TaxID=1819254 RepID=A0ABS4MFL2_9LACO|nr:alpha-glucosidase [Lactobacillus colini]MBP2058475.1 alpha-glucosidase [Lactobacillus colini]